MHLILVSPAIVDVPAVAIGLPSVALAGRLSAEEYAASHYAQEKRFVSTLVTYVVTTWAWPWPPLPLLFQAHAVSDFGPEMRPRDCDVNWRKTAGAQLMDPATLSSPETLPLCTYMAATAQCGLPWLATKCGHSVAAEWGS